jgi:hypothetical protein
MMLRRYETLPSHPPGTVRDDAGDHAADEQHRGVGEPLQFSALDAAGAAQADHHGRRPADPDGEKNLEHDEHREVRRLAQALDPYRVVDHVTRVIARDQCVG